MRDLIRVMFPKGCHRSRGQVQRGCLVEGKKVQGRVLSRQEERNKHSIKTIRDVHEPRECEVAEPERAQGITKDSYQAAP